MQENNNRTRFLTFFVFLFLLLPLNLKTAYVKLYVLCAGGFASGLMNSIRDEKGLAMISLGNKIVLFVNIINLFCYFSFYPVIAIIKDK